MYCCNWLPNSIIFHTSGPMMTFHLFKFTGTPSQWVREIWQTRLLQENVNHQKPPSYWIKSNETQYCAVKSLIKTEDTGKLILILVDDMQPVHTVDWSSFKKCCLPKYELPSQGTASHRFNVMYETEKSKLTAVLRTVKWTSATADTYSALINRLRHDSSLCSSRNI